MNRSNFRVKLDLCNFYDDVRRFSWIFVDGSKMMQISHIKQHITKLFNIKEPFHLLLNQTEYLPSNEDVRILEENETIVVSPGSGFETELEVSSNTKVIPEVSNVHIQADRTSNFVPEAKSEASAIVPSDDQITYSGTYTDVSTTDVLFHSVLEDNEESSANDSKATDSNITEDFSISNHDIPKRKRMRTRRRKKDTPVVEQNVIQKEYKAEKPKVINSLIISSGKHIRFNSTESENVIAKRIVNEMSPTGSHSNKMPPSTDLSNLLSLGKNSTPLTFANKRIKQEVKVERTSDEEMNTVTPPESTNENMNGIVKDQTVFSNEELEAYPIMTTLPKLKNIVAFKMLKIAADYTPQVSDFIVAEVVSFCPKTSVYTFRIIQGISEVQVPVGKFTLVQDEGESVLNDTITVNHAQIMEPRLISTSEPNKTATPNCY